MTGMQDQWWAFGLLGALALGSAAWAIYAFIWAAKNGQFRDLDAQSRSIFDEYEPEGTQTDHFPGHGPPPSEYLL